jgi:peptide/nickel transport system permease protein
VGAYIIRRLALIVPTLLLVTIIVFSTIRFIPGSVIDTIVSRMEYVTQADRASIEHALGMDVPVHIQYFRWIGNIVLHGDFGKSLLRGTPVLDEIVNRLPITLELGLIGLIVSQIIAIPIGIYSAIRQDTIGDYIGRSISILCIALPSFWLGTLVVVLPAVWWHWSPSVKYIPFAQNPGGNFVQFIIPGVILGMVLSGITMRMTRTMMLEVLRQDYIRTAWSKGLRERTVIVRHALKNALIPIVTVIGLQIPILIGGSVVLEQIFSLPGIGRLTVEVLNNRDYTVLSGINVVVATFVLFINLVVDLTYAYLDPRVTYK